MTVNCDIRDCERQATEKWAHVQQLHPEDGSRHMLVHAYLCPEHVADFADAASGDGLLHARAAGSPGFN